MRGLSRTRGGFTLVELLMVIAIIGILSALIIVSVQGAQKKARDAKIISAARDTATGVYQYQLDFNHYPIASELGVTDAGLTSGVAVQDANDSNPSLRKRLVNNYVKSASIYNIPAALVAKYVATVDGQKFAIAWPLEAPQAKFLSSGSGVYRNYSGLVNVPNISGKALEFTGDPVKRVTFTDGSMYKKFEFSSTAVYSNNSFTLSTWIKPDVNGCVSVGRNDCGIMGNGVLSYGDNFRPPAIRMKTATRVEAGAGNGPGDDMGNGCAWCGLQADVVPGSWNHIVLRYNSVTPEMALYINGVKQASLNQNIWVENISTDYFYLGTISISPDQPNYYKGLIDDPRIYNKAISDTELQQIYNYGAGIMGLPTDNGLLCAWNVDSGATNYSSNLVNGSVCVDGVVNGSPQFVDGIISQISLTGIIVSGTNPNGAFVTVGP